MENNGAEKYDENRQEKKQISRFSSHPELLLFYASVVAMKVFDGVV